MRVVAGVTKLSEATRDNIYSVKGFTINPKYDRRNQDSDIGIIELSTPLKLSNKVKVSFWEFIYLSEALKQRINEVYSEVSLTNLLIYYFLIILSTFPLKVLVLREEYSPQNIFKNYKFVYCFIQGCLSQNI